MTEKLQQANKLAGIIKNINHDIELIEQSIKNHATEGHRIQLTLPTQPKKSQNFVWLTNDVMPGAIDDFIDKYLAALKAQEADLKTQIDNLFK